MARKDPNPATETLEVVDSFFDRIAQRIADNPIPLASAVGTILVVALILSIVNTLAASNRDEASEAVGLVQTAYLDAMGAPLLSPAFDEPANPEAARSTREDYAARLIGAADQHAGTAPAAAGRMEAAALLSKLGDEEGARAQWRTAADEAASDSALRAAALFRLAASLEADDAAEASRSYETAARIDDFPGASMALAHAARTAADAGEDARALSLFAELEAEAEDGQLPAAPFVAARLRELRAAGSDGATE